MSKTVTRQAAYHQLPQRVVSRSLYGGVMRIYKALLLCYGTIYVPFLLHLDSTQLRD